ncbi:MAG: glycerophosphodiester phosphodiesterase family protein [Candidatus Neomarinimicrobiota bacterium]|jgi:glycerophosphoryl diester phosphodiesterase
MKRSLSFLLTALVLFTFAFAETKVIAHRGFSAKAPENTLIAFRKAIRSGADYFELDVHKTADDSVVVIHDGSVNRVCSNGISGNIAEMSFKESRAVRMGYPKKFGKKFRRAGIPTLKEALSLAKGKIKVCIEIKAADVEKAVLKTVNDLNMNNEVIIFAFSYDVLKNIRDLDPEIPILYLRSVVNEETIKMVKDISGNAIGAGLKTPLTPELLDQAHESGIELWQWTVNKEEDMKRLLNISADGIISDHPDKVLKLQKKSAINFKK